MLNIQKPNSIFLFFNPNIYVDALKAGLIVPNPHEISVPLHTAGAKVARVKKIARVAQKLGLRCEDEFGILASIISNTKHWLPTNINWM